MYSKFTEKCIMEKIISITELPNVNFSVSNVKAHFHYWKQNSNWDTVKTGREDHSLMFFINCRNTYKRENMPPITVNPSNIVYLPKGCVYSCSFDNIPTENKKYMPKNRNYENYYLDGKKTKDNTKLYNAVYVGFDIFDENHNPIKLSDDIKIFRLLNTDKVLNKFEDIAYLSKNGTVSPLKMNIALYTLILEISNNIQNFYSSSSSISVLQPALKYISENDLSDITVPQLAEICNISVSSFREKFKRELGISPINYLSELKIKKAQNMLADDTMSISTIAFNLGFSDIGYFSKFYKKHTGHSPSKRY